MSLGSNQEYLNEKANSIRWDYLGFGRGRDDVMRAKLGARPIGPE